MSGQGNHPSRPVKHDILRWLANTGGTNDGVPYARNFIAQAGAAAGIRVFEQVVKGKLKLTNDA